jgi:MFS family permease
MAARHCADTATASNMSGMTMAQSAIAADLDAYENAMWFTSSFLIAMSSCAPLAGRLATIFSPRTIVLVSSMSVGYWAHLTPFYGTPEFSSGPYDGIVYAIIPWSLLTSKPF